MSYLLLVIISAVSHTKCQFSNPGCVPRRMDEEYETIRTAAGERPNSCRHCQRLKPQDAHHCSLDIFFLFCCYGYWHSCLGSCERCVLRMDHHCPWVNNCVAMFNQKYFLQFLFYTGCQCLFCLVSLSSRFLYCSSQPFPVDANGRIMRGRAYSSSYEHTFNGVEPLCHPSTIDVLLCVLNFIEGVLFGLFTFIMLFDQLSAIFSNTPYIDQIKGKKGAKKKRYQSLIDVFGEPFSVSWFFPTPLTKQMIQNWVTMSNHYGKACKKMIIKRVLSSLHKNSSKKYVFWVNGLSSINVRKPGCWKMLKQRPGNGSVACKQSSPSNESTSQPHRQHIPRTMSKITSHLTVTKATTTIGCVGFE